ncbi:PDDEXK nuclease domain-containing protein [Dinghuibacter silviterrae]|uniref:Putative nuclease of restriction endonuclease-like (RecB) superfamily n=1 Tax=Dinghuibacter silviterrae TaxID=1539049 RepID=A0A4R8DQY9_9BACT|nr:PDDEXK nuclease domain-containing protein [Dinghuibacter silviterrae]TDX00572.1 putative nuclease of restriction endonuclease-like (RecB) superfamily [Dinghuibacter silviterrae]
MEKNMPSDYRDIVAALKEKIKRARSAAAYTLNGQLLAIYRDIGLVIADQEQKDGWGAKVVERLSKDLLTEFPDMKGLRPRNLRYMRDFALAYPHFPILQTSVAKLEMSNGEENATVSILQSEFAKLTWSHHILLLDKIKEPEIRVFYIRKTIEMGWTREEMVRQIEGGLHKRQGQIIHNFAQTTDDYEQITQVFKDPYQFDFICLAQEAKERDVEHALLSQLTKFLLELGQSFAFMGRQFRMTLGEKEYFIDLLFYHTKLKRYIVIELKNEEFRPEHIGKMSFYLTLADEQLKDERDGKSIGLILCKTKDGLVAEYALRDTGKAIGISQYRLNEKLPEEVKQELPSLKDIERNMAAELNELDQPIREKMDELLQKLNSIKKAGDEPEAPSQSRITR